MQIDFSKNHFELFQLPVAFELDLRALEGAYRELQREVHPDRYVNASSAEQRLAAQWATQANEAYRTLKTPLNRGRYILKIHGIDTEEESNTAMPLAFLMQQMEWREAVVDAKARKDEPALELLSRQKRDAETALISQLERQLADAAQRPDARETVRKLRFLEKLGEEIDIASESING